MSEPVELFVNYGALGAVLAYFIWRDKTLISKLTDALEAFRLAVSSCPKKEVS